MRVGLAVATDPFQQGRRSKHVGHALVEDGFDDLLGIHMGRPGGVHVRDNRRHAQGRIEEREERKRGQIDIIRRDSELGLDQAHLGIEYAVGVNRAFGVARAAGRKQDGRHLLRTRYRPPRTAARAGCGYR